MRVSTAEFLSRVNDLTDRAGTEPVTIADGGRDRLVLVSADEYARLKGRDERTVVAETPDEDVPAPVDASGIVGMPGLRGALKHTIIDVSEDIAEPTGEVWDAERRASPRTGDRISDIGRTVVCPVEIRLG